MRFRWMRDGGVDHDGGRQGVRKMLAGRCQTLVCPGGLCGECAAVSLCHRGHVSDLSAERPLSVVCGNVSRARRPAISAEAMGWRIEMFQSDQILE